MLKKLIIVMLFWFGASDVLLPYTSRSGDLAWFSDLDFTPRIKIINLPTMVCVDSRLIN